MDAKSAVIGAAGLGLLWWLLRPKSVKVTATAGPSYNYKLSHGAVSVAGNISGNLGHTSGGSFVYKPYTPITTVEELATVEPVPQDQQIYLPPMAAQQYLSRINEAERANGIPHNLLTRLLQQESHFNPAAVSPVGAQGIAQIMPATARDAGFGVPPIADPFDPLAAIPWAAKYLSALQRHLGSWDRALAAYNAGYGNILKALDSAGPNWLSQLPLETRNYVRQIGADIPVVFS